MSARRMQKKRKRDFGRVKVCRFCTNPDLEIDYKNVDLLRKFTNKRGKIIARRLSGLCSKHQRKVTRAIKRARYVALMPYVVYIYR
ncbi:MAG: 30S ribosomal protein S18 [Candidatus Zixiibacteriota bacterium]